MNVRASGATRILAAVTALTAWAALGLQLAILVGNMGAGAGLWRFVGFFTILTNLLTAIVATAIALGRTGGLAAPRIRLLTANAIALVGLVYTVALQGLWDPQGMQKVADIALHNAVPVLFVLTWLAAPHRGLSWKAIPFALLWPLAYTAYALLRGAADGWYAYWFLDPNTQGAGELMLSVAVLLGAFAAFAALLWWVDRRLARR